MILYGIPNCDTMKKARRWLENHDVDYLFHNYRKDGLDKKRLQDWCQQLGWENLLNKRGTTWRNLDEATRQSMDETQAITVMLEQPAIIKRPVLVNGNTILVGFNEADYKKLL